MSRLTRYVAVEPAGKVGCVSATSSRKLAWKPACASAWTPGGGGTCGTNEAFVASVKTRARTRPGAAKASPFAVALLKERRSPGAPVVSRNPPLAVTSCEPFGPTSSVSVSGACVTPSSAETYPDTKSATIWRASAGSATLTAERQTAAGHRYRIAPPRAHEKGRRKDECGGLPYPKWQT
jgi:hypothetical protein